MAYRVSQQENLTERDHFRDLGMFTCNQDNIKMCLKGTGLERVDCIKPTRVESEYWVIVNTEIDLQFP